MNKVANLKKITLSIQTGTSQNDMDLTPKHLEFEFIFGLGPAGMTPFENRLADRAEGEFVLLHIKKQECLSFFEHLNPPLMDLFVDREDIYLRVNIVAVKPAESREVVKAMAEIAAHGRTGCDCGCGCSG